MRNTPARHWQDLLPSIPKSTFKPLTAADLARISKETTERQQAEMFERMRKIGAQIQLAKHEGAMS